MRKWWIPSIVLILLFVLVGYVLLPAQQAITNYTFIGAAQNSVYRCLSDRGCLQNWWTDSSISNPNQKHLQKDGFTFQFSPRFGNVVVADIQHDNTALQSSLAVLALQADSSAVEWKTTFPPTGNIFKRFQHYFLARKLRHAISGQMQQLGAFMQDDKNIYGLDIQPARVTDTMVVTASMETTAYPTAPDYYNLVQQLKIYIAEKGAQETNFPMLNITPLQGGYQARVAIPINKALPSSGNIAFKRLIPGNILVAQVSGGPHAIEKGLQQLDYFVTEKNFRSPAIPFQLMVTDRLQERDTSKWITRLYYPVY
jgi:hypothetical protein